jgi:hypothetical protein
MGRFEYRYFNGVQWTPDVAINGQRYVDSPMGPMAQQQRTSRPPRGKAITSFVTAISAVVIGWVPFIFVLGVAAVIVAIVFGFLGLKSARQHDGYGRGFAIAGLALSPLAIAACVGGFFFTRAVVREFRDFVEPGPHELFVEQPCTLVDGRATLNGTIRNLDDHEHDYRIFVDFDDPGAGADSRSDTVPVRNVGAGETEPWSSSVNFDGSSVECTVTDVFGPVPFGFDQG